ncbi:MAG TPA: crosslink repair DNA glycosylase YcaQ family protein [Polyangiales bacterium]|nr:crosslink repair DNA glycosylase YcaQ family protein [Polyangiales bacterium]
MLSLSQARAAWCSAQGLTRAGNGAKNAVEVLSKHGLVRTLGGVDAYIALHARLPALDAEKLHGDVRSSRLRVVPAARGCMYLVAAEHVPAALRVAEQLSRADTERTREKAGVKRGEYEKVAKHVLDTLAKHGPLGTDALRKALPPGAIRSLGEAGKKAGLSSTLPPALRLLEFRGEVERTLPEGRLDTERYLWRIATPARGESDAERDDSSAFTELARVFFGAGALGTLEDFAEWSGLSQREAREALAPLSLTGVEVEDAGDAKATWLALPERVHELTSTPDTTDAIAFLPFEDNLEALHGGVSRLVDPAHHATKVPSWGQKRPATLGTARRMAWRTVMAEGRIVGFWEYDPDARDVVFACFDRLSPEVRERLAERAEALGTFLREQVGHGRSFSLDTDDALRERAARLRASAHSAPPKRPTVPPRAAKTASRRGRPRAPRAQPRAR